MSKTTFSFKEGHEERLLTISSHGYFQVFDKKLRDDVKWKMRGKFTDGEMVTTENPKYQEALLYEGECRHDLDLRLTDLEMGELAAKFFSEYLAITGGGTVDEKYGHVLRIMMVDDGKDYVAYRTRAGVNVEAKQMSDWFKLETTDAEVAGHPGDYVVTSKDGFTFLLPEPVFKELFEPVEEGGEGAKVKDNQRRQAEGLGRIFGGGA